MIWAPSRPSFHTPFGRHHQHGAAELTVDHNAHVQFAGDVEPLLDQQRLDLLAFFAGLLGDQHRAQHAGGVLLGFFGRPDQHHAPLLRMFLESSLAPSAGVNLGLDHGDGSPQLLEGGRRLGGCLGHNPLGDGNLRFVRG